MIGLRPSVGKPSVDNDQIEWFFLPLILDVFFHIPVEDGFQAGSCRSEACWRNAFEYSIYSVEGLDLCAN